MRLLVAFVLLAALALPAGAHRIEVVNCGPAGPITVDCGPDAADGCVTPAALAEAVARCTATCPACAPTGPVIVCMGRSGPTRVVTDPLGRWVKTKKRKCVEVVPAP